MNHSIQDNRKHKNRKESAIKECNNKGNNNKENTNQEGTMKENANQESTMKETHIVAQKYGSQFLTRDIRVTTLNFELISTYQ